MEKINVLNEKGDIIGEEYRDVIHKKGLLHAEVHVWCVTPKGELIFQHRAKDKDTYPDLLDATAGGHVDLGESYEEAAVKELEEETGLKAEESELVFLTTTIHKELDTVTGMTNHPRRNVYVYTIPVEAEALQIEAGKAIGFEAQPFEKLFELSEDERKRFIPTLLNEKGVEIFRMIQNHALR